MNVPNLNTAIGDYYYPKVQPLREVSELRLLLELSQALDQCLDLKNNIEKVLEAMARHMGMLRGTITLVDEDNQEIFIESAFGLSEKEKKRGRYKFGEGITGKVIESGRPLVVPKISEEPFFLNKTKSRIKVDLKKKDVSFICVPIKLENGVIGALSADRLFESDIHIEEDARLLAIIASLIAQSVKLRRDSRKEAELLMAENLRLKNSLKLKFRPDNIIGRSRSMQSVFDLVAHVSGSDSTVLIRGESGVGKELVAHAIHYNSNRSDKPFIKVNCAALPETVLASELFGHEKGSFTGATFQRKGRFELANGGTIFLDEIGDFSPSTQIALLRVIQEKAYERIGGTDTLKSDVRIIAATNRNLEDLMLESKFREDLFYRLNVFPIHIPPLRDRKTDVPLLADFFISKYNKIMDKEVKRISTQAIDMLMSYHWPGNVRELENCIERAVLLSSGQVILSQHLPPTLQTPVSSNTIIKGGLKETLANIEKELIIDSLKTSKGNMACAAKTLQISERIMGLRVKNFDIDPKEFKSTRL